MVGSRPGAPALAAALAGTLSLSAAAVTAGLASALGVAVGAAAAALVRARRRPRRQGMAPGRAPRGRVLRASGRRLSREPGARGVLPGGGRVPRGRSASVVGRGAAVGRRRLGASAVPGPCDRRAARCRRPRVAGGRPRRGPRHRPGRHGGRPRRGRRGPGHDRGTGTDPRRDLEGRLPAAGGPRPRAGRRVSGTVPAASRAVRAVDLGAARRRRHRFRRRLPPAVPHLVARGDRDRRSRSGT